MKKQKGFTLIELLIAIFILTVGILTVSQSFPLGVYIQKSAQMDTVANQLCQTKIEDFFTLSYGEIPLGTAEESYGLIVSFPSYKRRTEISYFDPSNPSVPSAIDLGIKKIKITVFWHSPMGVTDKKVIITNLIAER
jgi:prepilin-type N-terminal cleavage/methylation domain-containing protein